MDAPSLAQRKSFDGRCSFEIKEGKKKSDGVDYFSLALSTLTSSSLLFFVPLLLPCLRSLKPSLLAFSNLARAERCRRRCSPEGVVVQLLLLLQASASRRRRRRRQHRLQRVLTSSHLDEQRARFAGMLLRCCLRERRDTCIWSSLLARIVVQMVSGACPTGGKEKRKGDRRRRRPTATLVRPLVSSRSDIHCRVVLHSRSHARCLPHAQR